MKGLILLTILLLALPASSVAYIDVGESLEWLTSASEFVGIYRLRNVEATATQVYWIDVRCELETTLKGHCPDTLEIVEQPTNRVPFLDERILVFHNKRWFAPYFINLNHPEMKSFNCAITARFEVLVQADLILSVVQERISQLQENGDGPERYANAILVGVPDLVPAFRAIWEGHATFLAVPPDDEHKLQYLKQASEGDGFARVNAVCVLMNCYPGVPVASLLLDMLADNTKSWRSVGGVKIDYYPAREFAYEILLTMGVDVKPPESYGGELSHGAAGCTMSHWNRFPKGSPTN